MALFSVFAVLFSASAFAQDKRPRAATAAEAPVEQKAPETTTPQVPAPLVDDINGITLGMTADDVKSKLGKPDTSDSATMYYDLDKGEQVQLRLDADKKVSMIAGIYTGKNADAPDFSEVFGPAAQPVPQQNGTIYKLVRYPSAGYWVAYSRLELDNGPMTTVTLQKIGH